MNKKILVNVTLAACASAAQAGLLNVDAKLRKNFDAIIDPIPPGPWSLWSEQDPREDKGLNRPGEQVPISPAPADQSSMGDAKRRENELVKRAGDSVKEMEKDRKSVV